MKNRECDLFFNIGAGSEADSRFEELKGQLEGHGMRVVNAWKIGDGLEFPEALNQLKQSQTNLAVVAGGDGTLSGVTGVLIETQKLMGVVPSGTFNYFARNLQIPEDVTAAVANIFEGTEHTIPIAKVNDLYFLNNASFGLYPAALKKREEHYKRWGRGRLIACYSLITTLLGRPKIYRTVMHEEHRDVPMATPFVFVGANRFQLESMGLRDQDCVDKNKLAVYVTACLSFSERLWLTLKAIFRNLESATEYHVTCASSLSVELQKDRIHVAVDGEVRHLDSPLQFQLLPNALRILLPEGEKAPL